MNEFLTACSSWTTKYFWKNSYSRSSPRLYASFGAFCVQSEFTKNTWKSTNRPFSTSKNIRLKEIFLREKVKLKVKASRMKCRNTKLLGLHVSFEIDLSIACRQFQSFDDVQIHFLLISPWKWISQSLSGD